MSDITSIDPDDNVSSRILTPEELIIENLQKEVAGLKETQEDIIRKLHYICSSLGGWIGGDNHALVKFADVAVELHKLVDIIDEENHED